MTQKERHFLLITITHCITFQPPEQYLNPENSNKNYYNYYYYKLYIESQLEYYNLMIDAVNYNYTNIPT